MTIWLRLMRKTEWLKLLEIDMKKSIKLLTPQDVPKYLVEKGVIKYSKDVLKIKELTNGNIMFVTLVKLKYSNKNKKIIIRQALNYARVKTQFKITSERLNWEADALKKYRKLVQKNILPEIISHDLVNRILIMKDSLGTGKYFNDEYFGGIYHEDLLGKFAVFFASLHGQSYGKSEKIWMSRAMHTFWTRTVFIEHYLVGFLELFDLKEAKKILRNSENSTHCYCWMDPLIKNIIVEKNKFRIFDFEQATIWDPAYDIGAFIAPWYFQYLKGNIKYKYIKNYFDRYSMVMGRYKVKKVDIEGILERAMVYVHTTMLHVSIGNDQWVSSSKNDKDLILKHSKKYFSQQELKNNS